MIHELKDYLHLYLGCEVLSVDMGIIQPMKLLTENTLSLFESGRWKLLLRPLSDMTHDEAFEYMKISQEKTRYHDIRLKGVIEYIQETGLLPQEFIWALSKHFDLFGLIDAGLAIDKTKQ